MSALSAALGRLGRAREAADRLRHAVERLPDNAQLWTNFGVINEQLGEMHAALAAYDRALALPGTPAAARMNRGVLLAARGDLVAALENNQTFAAEAPREPAAHLNLAEVLNALERYREAAAACDDALALAPEYAKAWIVRGFARAALGELDAARADFERARAIDGHALAGFRSATPGAESISAETVDLRSVHLHALRRQFERCDWTRLPEAVEAFIRVAESADGTADDSLAFLGFGLSVPAATRLALARSVARHLSSQAASRPLASDAARRADGSRIRLAYVSPDFGAHPGAYLTRRLYALHDRGRFDVWAYALSPDDGSEVRGEIRRGCDRFVEAAALDGRSLAQRLREDGIDIAIDLSGYTRGAKPLTFAHRAAPLQVNYLGHPASMGAEFFDYAIVDARVCPPGSESDWQEKLVRLPDCYLMTNDREQVDPQGITRESLGLPAGAFVFCCFNNSWKIEPGVFDLWMEILAAAPDAVLWLFAPAAAVEHQLRREAQQGGQVLIRPQRAGGSYLAACCRTNAISPATVSSIFSWTRWSATRTAPASTRSGRAFR